MLTYNNAAPIHNSGLPQPAMTIKFEIVFYIVLKRQSSINKPRQIPK